MKKNNIVLSAFVLILLVCMIGFVISRRQSATHISGKLPVSASFYPLAFFATQIGGEKAAVTNITPAGAEPHDYEPTARDIATIETSRLVIINGQFEAWGDRIQSQSKDNQSTVIAISDGLTAGNDPHIWLSPSLAKQIVSRILDGFMSADPENANYYRANATLLEAKLSELDNGYQDGLAHCARRDFVTAHNSFGYLAKTYNLNQVSISGLSPDEEPSVKQLAAVAHFARGKNINYIFFERLVSPRLSETVAAETGAKTMVLDPIEGVSEEDIQKGKNYFTIMKDNLINLRTALECQ